MDIISSLGYNHVQNWNGELLLATEKYKYCMPNDNKNYIKKESVISNRIW